MGKATKRTAERPRLELDSISPFGIIYERFSDILREHGLRIFQRECGPDLSRYETKGGRGYYNVVCDEPEKDGLYEFDVYAAPWPFKLDDGIIDKMCERLRRQLKRNDRRPYKYKS